MKTELEAVSSVKKRLKVEVPSDLVTQARAQAVSELGKKAKVEGFRPGHIPPQIIEKKFGHELQQMTIEKVVDQTLGLAFEQAKLRPISKPEINPGMWSAVGNFSYTATFEVLPEMTLKDYKGLKLEKTEVKMPRTKKGKICNRNLILYVPNKTKSPRKSRRQKKRGRGSTLLSPPCRQNSCHWA